MWREARKGSAEGEETSLLAYLWVSSRLHLSRSLVYPQQQSRTEHVVVWKRAVVNEHGREGAVA